MSNSDTTRKVVLAFGITNVVVGLVVATVLGGKEQANLEGQGVSADEAIYAGRILALKLLSWPAASAAFTCIYSRLTRSRVDHSQNVTRGGGNQEAEAAVLIRSHSRSTLFQPSFVPEDVENQLPKNDDEVANAPVEIVATGLGLNNGQV